MAGRLLAPPPHDEFTSDDLDRLTGATKKAAQRSAILLNLAAGEPPPPPYRPTARDLEYFVAQLQEAFVGLKVSPDQIDDFSLNGPKKFAGIEGLSFHDVAFKIARAILQAVADSIEGVLFFGPSPKSDWTWVAKITALEDYELSRTGLADRLQRFERFDMERFSLLLDSEAAQVRLQWRERDAAQPVAGVSGAGEAAPIPAVGTGGGQAGNPTAPSAPDTLLAQHTPGEQPKQFESSGSYFVSLYGPKAGGMTDAQIRDHWQGMREAERKALCATQWGLLKTKADQTKPGYLEALALIVRQRRKRASSKVAAGKPTRKNTHRP